MSLPSSLLRFFQLAVVINAAFSISCCNAISIPITRDGSIRLQTAPLIGGPSWLPVHVKVLILPCTRKDNGVSEDECSRFDYVPLNPTSKDTLRNLLLLRAVPAQARYRIRPPKDVASPTGEKILLNSLKYDRRNECAETFCANYDKELHLWSNNCWTFAFELITHVLRNEELKG